MRIGDAVRLKPDSPLRERLRPFADAVGRVVDTYQVDDDELCLAVAYDDDFKSRLSPLSADEFVIDASRPDEPF